MLHASSTFRSGWALAWAAWLQLGYALGRAVLQASTTTQLDTGTTMTGVADLKKALLARQDDFVTGFAEKLLTYACGRSLRIQNKASVKQITRQTQAAHHQFQALVLAAVRSPSFQQR